ncbi:MAG: hypothetical protein IJR70_02695 [Eubacterium sp.]|nr:hypothetical protein [Eubacterium sp.]
MKNKFIRIISPMSLAMAIILDTAVIYYIIYAFNKLEEKLSAINILFAIIAFLSLILAIFYSREVIRHGIRFSENEFEITFLDENNFFRYDDIQSIETYIDTKASLKKNFVDRYSRITLNLDDNSSVTLELGITTKKKLKKIEEELSQRIKNARN